MRHQLMCQKYAQDNTGYKTLVFAAILSAYNF